MNIFCSKLNRQNKMIILDNPEVTKGPRMILTNFNYLSKGVRMIWILQISSDRVQLIVKIASHFAVFSQQWNNLINKTTQSNWTQSKPFWHIKKHDNIDDFLQTSRDKDIHKVWKG